MENLPNILKDLYQFFNIVIYVVGTIVTFLFVLGGVATIVAWIKGISIPLWRLGIGLSRREIHIVGSSEDCNSLTVLLLKSSLFKKKNIHLITSLNDAKELSQANLILIKLSDSPINIEEALQYKNPETSMVIYARPKEITQWNLLDQHRNISVTNLRGRLMTDLLNALMTTGYEKK